MASRPNLPDLAPAHHLAGVAASALCRSLGLPPESVFEKCGLLRDPSEHGGGGGDADEGFGDVGALLEVAHQAAVLDEPSEGALDHPSARQRLEARQGARPLDDGKREVGLLLRPRDEFAGISTIGEHGLDEGPEAARGA